MRARVVRTVCCQLSSSHLKGQRHTLRDVYVAPWETVACEQWCVHVHFMLLPFFSLQTSKGFWVQTYRYEDFA